MSSGKNLRQAMQTGTVAAPYVVDGMQAILTQAAQFQAAYLTGFGTAATYGLPDVGLITMTQMCEKIRTITDVVEIPLIVDADTGYGNYVNVIKTVHEYERAGAAALHLEDQVWPKRCGYMLKKQVISKEEAATKIRAAVDARRDQGFVVIARTDALAVNGWDDVEDRLRAYVAEGADMVFVDGIKSVADMAEYAKRMHDVPAILNNAVLMSMETIRQYENFKLVIHPGPMTSAWAAYSDALEGVLHNVNGATEIDQQGFNQLIGLLGAPKYFEMDRVYGGRE